MTILYLVRHARSIGNAAQQIQGWLDLPLDDYGRKQARHVSERLRHKPLAAIYSSPLLRAADTARAIAEPHNIPVLFDQRLREYHMGAWTGLTAAEIELMMPPHRWSENMDHIGPGAESGLEMRARVSAFLSSTLHQHPGQMVVVVCHGGTLGAMVSAILDLPPIRRQPFHFGNTSITKVSNQHGRWHISSLNDRCHLRSLTSGGDSGDR